MYFYTAGAQYSTGVQPDAGCIQPRGALEIHPISDMYHVQCDMDLCDWEIAQVQTTELCNKTGQS